MGDQRRRAVAAAAEPRPLEGVQVLVVHDDEMLGRSYARSLVKQGAVAKPVARVRAALAELARRRESLDALLVDEALPDGEAHEVVRAAREEGCAAGIVVVTKRGQAIARRAAIRWGACKALLEPCGVAELMAAVRFAQEAAAERRTPVAIDISRLSTPSAEAERVLRVFIALLRRAGLRGVDAEALLCRAQGLSVSRSARQLGISPHRLRARLSDGLGDLEADSAYALLGVLARHFADAMGEFAGSGAEPTEVLTHVEALVGAASTDDAAPHMRT